MTKLLRNRRVMFSTHLLIILGLVVSIVITDFHQSYMTRGTTFTPSEQPIPHTDVNPLGVNTFLHEEVDPERVDQTLDLIAEGGFTWIRQIFVWSEIEQAPGEFWDERHDISTWDKYDRIVEAANERGLEIVARLDKPPVWAQVERGNVEEFPDGPPDNYQDYADFVTTVLERYQGQISYVQLWNEPNLGVEWGGLDIDPAEFTELLRVGYEAAKAVDPAITVLMPGLAPNDQTGPENMSDLLFLEGMYEAGAADYFDIAAVMIYGYGFSPWDRRLSFERNNFSRPVQTREIMEEYGDHDKPIWAVEYGWVSLPEDWDGDPSPWGEPVTEEQQANYLYDGYLRAQREWPWMGAMMVWAFRWATDPQDEHQIHNPTRGFRIVGHDFQTRPAYDVLRRNAGRINRAYTGQYGAISPYLQTEESWMETSRESSTALQPEDSDSTAQIPFAGTGIRLNMDGTDGAFELRVDDTTWDVTANDLSDGAFHIDGLSDGPHLLEIRTTALGDSQLAITGFAVERHIALAWAYPWLYGAIILVIVLNLVSLTGTIFWHRTERG